MIIYKVINTLLELKKKGFMKIYTNLYEGKSQIDISILRENANMLGI